MAESLASQTLLSTGVPLPKGFLCDDTTLGYNVNGEPVNKKDDDALYSDNVFEEDHRIYHQFIRPALKHFNSQHKTDYKASKSASYTLKTYAAHPKIYHIGFYAALPGCGANYFCSKLLQEVVLYEDKYKNEEEPVVVTSCVIVDGPSKCEECHLHASCFPEQFLSSQTVVSIDDGPREDMFLGFSPSFTLQPYAFEQYLASRTLLSTGVPLPEGFLCDDTTLVYNVNGEPVNEKDYDDLYYDDEVEKDARNYPRFVRLAVEHYNFQHKTDYKALPRSKSGYYMATTYAENTNIYHIGFHAVLPGCGANFFCSKLLQEVVLYEDEDEYEYKHKEEEPVFVTSCIIVDGPSKCQACHSRAASFPSHRLEGLEGLEEEEEVVDKTRFLSVVPPASEYRHLLADGVSLSDRAKLRLRFTLIALPDYNRKNGTDYKLVDVLPITFGTGESTVAHCNFIAKENGDFKNKLFFAEIGRPLMDDHWTVICCCIVHGKTKAGCYMCSPHLGRRVIHPMGGYRFGVRPIDEEDPNEDTVLGFSPSFMPQPYASDVKRLKPCASDVKRLKPYASDVKRLKPNP